VSRELSPAALDVRAEAGPEAGTDLAEVTGVAGDADPRPDSRPDLWLVGDRSRPPGAAAAPRAPVRQRGVRAWLARGRVGPAPTSEVGRQTGARC